MERDEVTSTLEDIGAVVLANACGPCIGQVCVRYDQRRSVLIFSVCKVETRGQERRRKRYCPPKPFYFYY